MKDTDIAPLAPRLPAIRDNIDPPSAGTLIALIEKIAATPNLTSEAVEVIERLVAMQERQDAQRRKQMFDEALLRVQSKSPRIAKNGLMDRGPGKGQIPYAKREDIDAVMRPIYQAEGFSVTWDAPMSDNRIQVIGRFSAHGHTEQREWSCLPDSSGGKQNPQAAGSTIAYGQRYISTMFWDVISEGADANGARREDVEAITQEQADEIRTRLNDLTQKHEGWLLDAMCRKYGIGRPEDIRQGQYKAILSDVEIEEKKRQRKAER